MDSASILDELLGLLQAQNIPIRRVSLDGKGGGLCKVRGQDVFFLDTQADSADIAAKCAEAVAKVVDIESIYIKPEIREILEKYRDGA
jgi:hypothetical protein